jgi:putative membrane protein
VPEAVDARSKAPRREIPGERRFRGFFPPAPPLLAGVAYLIGLSLVLGFLAFGWAHPLPSLLDGVGVFTLPALIAALGTPSLTAVFGGKFAVRRSTTLALLSLVLAVPFVAGYWAIRTISPSLAVPTAIWIVLLVQAPIIWFRHLSLFAMSTPRHGSALPASLLQPALSSVFAFVLLPFTAATVVFVVIVFALGWLCAAQLLRMADRPIRREFGSSGVGLIRPLMEHVGSRDPQATEQLERFFGTHAVEADLRVTVVQFRTGGVAKATIALPTVHPGPFAAVGASDLPRKLASSLTPGAGTVFVPHTPCNHDLDLPGEAEVDRIRTATRDLLAFARVSPQPRASPLVSPRPGSLVRAQVLGEAVLTIISQAPEASDDIDYAIVNPYYGRSFGNETPVLAFIDGHNSYYNDTGDLTYGSPVHRQLALDLEAAIPLALGQARSGSIRVGVATRTDYSVVDHGIGPEGLRVLVVEAAGARTAYILLDGNNLVKGLREPILEAVRDLVDAAEVMTTDNHVVHEVDGSLNVLGQRYPIDRLAHDIRAVVERALADLTPVEVAAASGEVPSVRVLGPGWTVRLLTSLGDTLSVFANSALLTFLLLVTSSMVALAVLQ